VRITQHSVDKRRAPQLLRWISRFVGHSELSSAIERVRNKLLLTDLRYEPYRRKYRFHTGLDIMRRRLRLGLRMQAEDYSQAYALNLLASLYDTSLTLTDSGLDRLRGTILGYLRPDRDIRALAHEMQVFQYLKTTGFNPICMDLNGMANYDFLAIQNNVEFEVECKTFSDDLGSSITTEEAAQIIGEFSRAVDQVGITKSGIFNLVFPGRYNLALNNFGKYMREFLVTASEERHFDHFHLRFDHRADWGAIQKNPDVSRMGDGDEFTSFVKRTDEHVVVLIIMSRKSSALKKGALKSISRASSQLSGTRAGIIWIDLLGLGQDDFRLLSDMAPAGALGAFTAHVFLSPKRSHVTHMVFGSEDDGDNRSRGLLLGAFGVPNLILRQKVVRFRF
jgi:hypothetical protein